jgi:hypothetical protein
MKLIMDDINIVYITYLFIDLISNSIDPGGAKSLGCGNCPIHT